VKTAAFGQSWAELPAASEGSGYTESYSKCVRLITDAPKQSNGYYRRNYSICYDTKNYVARWVAYPMHSYYRSGSNDSEEFVTDPNFSTSQQIGSTYKNSAYNRGHQLAKAQRRVTALAREQSNYYTNMTPQNATLNSGEWLKLEEKERGAWMCSDTLYMVSGCHFDNYNTKVANNDGKSCPAPTHYFKVMLRTKSGNSGKKVSDCSASELKCAAYLVANSATATPQLMSVEALEKIVGFTFFVNVPNAPKSTYSASEW